MKRILLAIISASLLGGCAHWHHAHGEHAAAAGDMPACQGQGKEGDICPLRNKEGASSMPDCCKGKKQQATSGSN